MKYNFKILGSSSLFPAVEYNAKKEKQGTAGLLYVHNFPESIDLKNTSEEQLRRVLEDWSCNKVNDRFVNVQFHATITAKGKGNDLTDMKEHAMKVMEHLGYGNNPIYMYAHSDTANDHIHIVTSRVDEFGGKIDDGFERTRANSFLCQLLDLKLDEKLKKDLDESLSYTFTSVNHFLLLLEQKGYQHRSDNNKYLFFKHGKTVGSIDTIDIKKRIRERESLDKEKSKKRLFAIINAYKKSCDSTLKKTIDNNKALYHSELTEKLKKDLGVEFVFFGDKAHDNPYGFVIIDHGDKTIYKGSDVLSLSKLITPNNDHVNDSNRTRGNERSEGNARSLANERASMKQGDSVVSTVNQSFELLDLIFDFGDVSSIGHDHDDFTPTSTTKKRKKKKNRLDRKNNAPRHHRR